MRGQGEVEFHRRTRKRRREREREKEDEQFSHTLQIRRAPSLPEGFGVVEEPTRRSIKRRRRVQEESAQLSSSSTRPSALRERKEARRDGDSPDIMPIQLHVFFRYRSCRWDPLKVREYGWGLDVDEEEEDEEGVAVGGEGSSVGRVDFSGERERERG